MAKMMAKLLSFSTIVSIFAPHAGEASVIQGGYAPRPAPAEHRSLQTVSNIIWISPLESDAEELRSIDGTTIAIDTGTQYELFFEVPDSAQATGFELTFVGQLAGAGWSVDIFNFNFGANGAYETDIGTLAGLTAASTGEVSITYSTSSPADYIDSTSDPSDTIPEVLLRLRGGETGNLDFSAVAAIGGAPAAAPAPVASPTPGATTTPVAPSPAAQPVATPDGASLCLFVEREFGASILPLQQSCSPLGAIEGASVSRSDTSIEFASTANEQAAYNMYFEAPEPATLTGDLAISFTAQLGAGATASHWTVGMYNTETGFWDRKGDLNGVASEEWTTVEVSFSSASPTEYVDATTNEFLVRLSTDDALSNGAEVIYVDQVVIFAGSAPSTTPAPADATPAPIVGGTVSPAATAPTVAPVVGVTTAPATNAPVAPVVGSTTAPAPVAPVVVAPTPSDSAVYVIKITGGEILLAQMGGEPIAGAEGGATTDSTTSIEFASTSSQPAEYELYFDSPAATIEGDLMVSITAQLGNSAVAADWKVDVYNRATDEWDPMGADNTLAGISLGQWTTVTKTVASSTPTAYIEQSSNEILIRLLTDNSGVQVIYVDEVRLSAEGLAVVDTPAPASAATPAPSTVPVLVTTAPIAATVAPVAGTTAPAVATATPVAATIAPAAATLAPALETTAPVAVTVAPAVVTTAPVLATAVPVAATVAPAAATTAPAVPTTAPIAATVAPAAATTAPAVATTAPIAATIAPAAVTTAPVVVTTAPIASTIAPAAATTAPALATTAPVASTIAPAAVTTAPVVATTAPVLATIAPAAVTTAPAVATAAPIASTIAPVVATSAPAVATASPVTAAPTIAPVLPTTAPVTSAPTSAPINLGDVDVDLVPCILAQADLARDVAEVASAYMFGEYFKGFWTATQIVETEIAPTDVLDLVMDDNANHGKCNVVFVGIVLSDDQKLQLQDYSRKFKVRVVYFDIADTILDTEVQTRLGMQSLFDQDDGTADWVGDWTISGPPRVKLAGGTTDSVVRNDLETNPKNSDIFNRPVEQTAPLATGVSILANYASEDGTVLLGTTNAFDGAQSVGIAEYIGADGLEEMHVFLGLAWFDVGSWAWAHFIAEWGSRGIFQGERRFYLGAVDDDLFLSTGQWEYLPNNDFFGAEVRLTDTDLAKFQAAEQGFGNVKTEHAFNGLGILDEVYANVESPWRSWDGVDADIALLEKGQKPQDGGIPQVTKLDWLSTTFNPAEGVAGIANDIDLFATDQLLVHVQENLDAFYWQSHTFSHLARDDLGFNDCLAEDAGNVQIALLLGLYDSENYNWRSMTSPGITGLFNENCLRSGAANLMKCYPGDNTYTLANTNPTTVSLINEDNQFHSLTTTVGTNGFSDMQIVPRFATNVYFNCVTGKCLVDENEKIRRDVCECAELDPSLDKGSCSNSDCTVDGVTNIQSFNNVAELENPSEPKPLQALFETEERTTTRYVLSGRRDKYMFHQANLISTEWTEDPTDPLYVSPRPTDSPSLLEYWYIRVLAEMGKYLNTETFPIETLKFDNLCHNFYQHEYLDNSGAVLTATKDSTGAITGMTLATTSENGAPIPLTVPTADADSVSLGSLIPSETETYGADTTYRFAAGTLDAGDLDKPDLDDLYEIPQAQPATPADEAAQDAADAELAQEAPALLETAEEAAEEADEVANEAGFAAPSLNQ